MGDMGVGGGDSSQGVKYLKQKKVIRIFFLKFLKHIPFDEHILLIFSGVKILFFIKKKPSISGGMKRKQLFKFKFFPNCKQPFLAYNSVFLCIFIWYLSNSMAIVVVTIEISCALVGRGWGEVIKRQNNSASLVKYKRASNAEYYVHVLWPHHNLLEL